MLNEIQVAILPKGFHPSGRINRRLRKLEAKKPIKKKVDPKKDEKE